MCTKVWSIDERYSGNYLDLNEISPIKTEDLMNEKHEANRKEWNRGAAWWKNVRDEDGLWKIIPEKPDLAFAGSAYQFIQEYIKPFFGKKACVIGSGDNYAVFALASMGMKVTSLDISEAQLSNAVDRAKELGLKIDFIRSDASEMKGLSDNAFDLVFSSNGFYGWISDLNALFNEVARILKKNGYYISYDVHPFQRPWINDTGKLELGKPYSDTRPLTEDPETDPKTFEFQWTLADILNPPAKSGLKLLRIGEDSAKDSRFWQDYSYLTGTDNRLLDWKYNPRAAFPVWLTIAVQKC